MKLSRTLLAKAISPVLTVALLALSFGPISAAPAKASETSITINTISDPISGSHPFPFNNIACESNPLYSPVSIAGSGQLGDSPPGQLDQYHIEVVWGDGSIENDDDAVNDIEVTWNNDADHTFSFTAGPHPYDGVVDANAITVHVYHSTPPGNDGTADSTFTVPTCVFVPPAGSITIVKNTVGGDGTFDFTGSGAIGTFSLTTVDGTVHQTFTDLDAGTYSVAETEQTGWTSDGGTCLDQDNNTVSPGNIDLASGDSVVCAFTNTADATPPATLHVVKVLINDDGGSAATSSFSFSVNGDSAVAFEEDGQNDLSVAPGTYSVSETEASGYTTTYDNCSDVALASGEEATCTITNDDNAPTPTEDTLALCSDDIDNDGDTLTDLDDPDCSAFLPQLTIVKNTEGGDGTFTFRITGQDDVSVATEDGVGSSTDLTLATGTYEVSELVPTGWTQTDATCDNDQDPSEVTLAAGDHVTCTFSNTKAPTLTIIKNTDNGDGTFNFTLSGVTSLSTSVSTSGGEGSTTVNLNEGTTTVSELAQQGWNFASSNCVYDNESTGFVPVAGSEEIHVDAGDAVTCTFNNTKVVAPGSADVSITKSVSDAAPQVGTEITYTLTATNAGPDSATGVVVADLLPFGVTYVSDDSEGTYNATTGEWSVGTLGDEASATTHITVRVNDDKAGEQITNVASISSAVADANTANNSSGNINITPHSQHHGGGGGSSHTTPPPTGQVLGASTSTPQLGVTCGLFMNQHLRRGSPKNSADQVTRLQQYLVDNGYGSFTPTGFFGPLTEAAVKAFQLKHADEVLKPWNLFAPTGLVYLTTLRAINLNACPTLVAQLELPAVLIPWSQNPNAQ